LGVCFTSAVGTADADAPPINEKVNPAAPNAGIAALVTRFRFEASFTRGIVESSIPVKIVSESSEWTVSHWLVTRKVTAVHTTCCSNIGFTVHVDERNNDAAARIATSGSLPYRANRPYRQAGRFALPPCNGFGPPLFKPRD
jgi:hypothetical protein